MIQTIKDLVSAKADTTVALAKEIWGYAELSYEETKSAAALIAALKQEGFTIEEGIAGHPHGLYRHLSMRQRQAGGGLSGGVRRPVRPEPEGGLPGAGAGPGGGAPVTAAATICWVRGAMPPPWP